jgi:hypothetical protein
VPSDQRAELDFALFFPLFFHFHRPFMLATLELNTSHNHLYGSILGHAISCIDEPFRKCKIELPKPQHVVSVRALDTIGCGLWRPQTALFRVLENRSPKSGALSRIDRSATDLIACIQMFTFVLVGCPLTLVLGRMPRWPQQTPNP